MSQGMEAIRALGTQAVGQAQERKYAGPDFKDVLIKSLSEVNDLQIDAEKAISGLALGKTENVTEVMAAVEKADLAFKNLMAIRNKIVDAYKEIQSIRI